MMASVMKFDKVLPSLLFDWRGRPEPGAAITCPLGSIGRLSAPTNGIGSCPPCVESAIRSGPAKGRGSGRSSRKGRRGPAIPALGSTHLQSVRIPAATSERRGREDACLQRARDLAEDGV